MSPETEHKKHVGKDIYLGERAFAGFIPVGETDYRDGISPRLYCGGVARRHPGRHRGTGVAGLCRDCDRSRRDPDLVLIARTDARGVHDLDTAIQRAREYVEAGADWIFPEALASAEEFKALIHIAPEEPLGHANLGLAYLRMNDQLVNAEKSLDQALKLSPNSSEIKFIIKIFLSKLKMNKSFSLLIK